MKRRLRRLLLLWRKCQRTMNFEGKSSFAVSLQILTFLRWRMRSITMLGFQIHPVKDFKPKKLLPLFLCDVFRTEHFLKIYEFISLIGNFPTECGSWKNDFFLFWLSGAMKMSSCFTTAPHTATCGSPYACPLQGLLYMPVGIYPDRIPTGTLPTFLEDAELLQAQWLCYHSTVVDFSVFCVFILYFCFQR